MANVRETTWMTLPELLRLSAFDLPAVHRSDPASWKALRRGRIKAATRARIRHMDSLGLFDELKRVKVRGPKQFPVVIWSRPHTQQGTPRLYSDLDLAIVRLFGWMRREELSTRQIVSVLRGKWAARVVLTEANAWEPDRELVVSCDSGGIHRVSEFDAVVTWWSKDGLPPLVSSRFPIAWLGMFTEALPRLSKMREDTAFLTSHRQLVPIPELLKDQVPRPVATELRAEVFL